MLFATLRKRGGENKMHVEFGNGRGGKMKTLQGVLVGLLFAIIGIIAGILQLI